ncbi:universal stress protein [Candidatus Nitrosotalea bavarica]|uniref:universal stress protein n=1 Tax=Candidatus Nitrosotalea bavarica TaxID=1903277 RepID=UPI000C70C16B|nr:universal stress protein [Candidatus Nitrosotalea bavarica]
MSLSKNSENDEVANQISTIRETIKIILKNAKYGSNENLLRDLSKIDSVSSRMQSKLTGTYPVIQKYRKILVPYDGSIFSKNALSESLEMAKVFHSKIYVLSVIEVVSDIPSGILSEVINKKLDKLKREISLPKKFIIPTKLQHQIDECTKYGVEVQVEVLMGRPSDSILKFATQTKTDLIVIGSHGLRGMKKLAALGSVSRRVSEEAKCPVMIIR